MANWGTDDLTKFLQVVHTNQRATVSGLPGPYNHIQRVNDCFLAVGKNLVDPKPVMTGVLFLRSQYAYKAAAGMASSGQVTETFAMMRLWSPNRARLWAKCSSSWTC